MNEHERAVVAVDEDDRPEDIDLLQDLYYALTVRVRELDEAEAQREVTG